MQFLKDGVQTIIGELVSVYKHKPIHKDLIKFYYKNMINIFQA